VYLGASIALLTLRQTLGQAVEDQDREAFTTELQKYDQVNRLDQWFTKLFLKIKKQIPDPDDIN